MSVDNAKLIITPNGYKAGKLYSVKPNDGTLDVNWQRNGSATRVNGSGLIESVGNDVPRLDYTSGSCPSLLVEEQRTNLLQNSDGDLNDYQNFNVSNSDSPILNFSNSISFPSGSIRSSAYNRSFQAQSGNTYSLSFFIKMNDNSIPVVGSNTTTGDFSIIFYGSFFSSLNIIHISKNVYRIKATKNATSTSTQVGVIRYEGQSGKSFKITGLQLEEALSVTSYIPTTNTTVTRPADAPQSITPPIGTTEIKEVFEDGSENVITIIPPTYTIPFGRFKYIIFS